MTAAHAPEDMRAPLDDYDAERARADALQARIDAAKVEAQELTRQGYPTGVLLRVLDALPVSEEPTPGEHIRQAKEEAWDECARALHYDETAHTAKVHNPYRAALVSEEPAPERPKLDPEPYSIKRIVGRSVIYERSAKEGVFDPGPGFEQDRSCYES